MLKREIMNALEQWHASKDKKALCIYGARQVGKTTIVREFAKKHYSCFLELNFLEDQRAAQIFENSANTQEILLQLSLLSDQELTAGKTLILLDEIQECPQARTAVKFLVEEGRYDYIETGSLLEVKFKDVASMPVGFEESINMYPLNFKEFLWAMNIKEEIINTVEECYKEKKKVPAYIHENFKQLFLTYIVVGGMPEAVNDFVKSKNLAPVIKIQKSISDLYAKDILKYTLMNQRVKIQQIYQSVPAQLNKPNNRFFLNQVLPKARLSQFEDSFAWLIESGIVLPSYNVSEPQPPLLLNEKRNLFKLFMLDSGLLCSNYEGIQLKILQQDSTLNWGSILENVTAQNLVSNGYELFYFNSKRYGEIDFLTQNAGQVSLIECKTGSDYKKHAALNKILEVPNWNFDQKIVFCMDNVSIEKEILYLPWYMMMFYKKEPVKSIPVSFNLEGLQIPD